MPRTKSIRVKRWKVQVFQNHVCQPVVYTVYAVDQWDARLLAFALDGGFAYSMTEMEEDHTQLAMECTKILESS